MTFKVKTQERKLQQNNKACRIPIYCYYNENIKVWLLSKKKNFL